MWWKINGQLSDYIVACVIQFSHLLSIPFINSFYFTHLLVIIIIIIVLSLLSDSFILFLMRNCYRENITSAYTKYLYCWFAASCRVFCLMQVHIQSHVTQKFLNGSCTLPLIHGMQKVWYTFPSCKKNIQR